MVSSMISTKISLPVLHSVHCALLSPWAAQAAAAALVAGLVIEHGHSSQLHDAVWSQINGLKCTEVH